MTFLALSTDSVRSGACGRKIGGCLKSFSFRAHAIQMWQPVGLHIHFGVMVRQPLGWRFRRFEVAIRKGVIELVEFFRMFVHVHAK